MAAVVPKCNILNFVSDYLIRRTFDLSMNKIDSKYLKQDFIKRNITCENADTSCIIKDLDCNNRITNVVPDTCTCSEFVNAYVLKEGVTYFLIVNFDIETSMTCPIVLGLVTPFTTATVTINNMSDFSYSSGTIRTKKVLIGGYPEIELTILKQNGTICENKFDVNICNSPSDYTIEIKQDGTTFLLAIKYNDCGNDCHEWQWNYLQISPAVGLPDSGVLNSVVNCDTLPYDSVTVIEPKGSLTTGTIIQYRLTGTDCCNNTIIKNVSFEIPSDEGIFLYRSVWKDKSSSSFMPYTYFSWTISNGIDTAIIPTTITYTTLDEDALLISLNSIVTTAGLTGNITRDILGNFYYNKGVGETITVSNIRILYKYYSVRYNALSTGNTTTLLRCKTPTEGYMIVDWGDGSLDSYLPTGSVFPATHAYTSISSYITANYFHDDDIVLIRLDSTFTTPPVCEAIDFTGTLPSNLATFALAGLQLGLFTGYVLNLDFSVCKDKLVFLGIAKTNLVFLANTIMGNNFPLLNVVNIGNNKLPISEVDKAFNLYVSSTPTITSGGSFRTDMQTPSSPPSPVSGLSRNILITNGWSVIID